MSHATENAIVMFIVAAVFAFAGYYFGYEAGFQKAADIYITAISNAPII